MHNVYKIDFLNCTLYKNIFVNNIVYTNKYYSDLYALKKSRYAYKNIHIYTKPIRFIIDVL